MRNGLPILRWLPILVAAGCSGGDSGGGGRQVFTIDLSPSENGDFTISGEVSLPADTASGHTIQFVVSALDSSPNPYTVIESVGNTNGGSGFGFRIVGPNDGVSYRVRSAVDLDDSGALDTGDLVGWYGGTVAAPVQVSSSAASITIAGASVDDADFGIGPLP